MDENKAETVKVYGKEMNSPTDNKFDYVGDKELLVTITLAEYRDLVKKSEQLVTILINASRPQPGEEA